MRSDNAAVLYAKLIMALASGPSSLRELSDETGLSYDATRRYVAALRDHRDGKNRALVRIKGWAHDSYGRPSIPLFLLERGRDLPKPKLTREERNRRNLVRYHSRKAADPANPFNLDPICQTTRSN